jgi:hypothetical protein
MGSSQSYIWINKGDESQKYHKVFKNVQSVFGGVKAPVKMNVNDDRETFVYAFSDLSEEKFIGSIQSCNHPCYNLTRFYVGKKKGTVDLMNVFVTYGVTSRETMIGVKVEDIVMECDDFRKRGTIRIKDNDVGRYLKETQRGKYRDMYLLVTDASLKQHTKAFGTRKCPKFTDMFHTMKRVLTDKTAAA